MDTPRLPFECPARETTAARRRAQVLLGLLVGCAALAGSATLLVPLWTAPDHEALGRGTFLVLNLLVAGLLLPGLFLAAYMAIAPRRLRYRIEPGVLTVRTWLVTRTVTLFGAVARTHSPAIAVRLAGTALPGYYAGLFRANGKNLRIYATADRDGIEIESDRRVWVTPPDNAAFLAALQAAGARIEG